MFRVGDFNHALVRQKGSRRLQPDQRRAERSAFHLRDVVRIIQSDRDELARRDRQIDLRLAQRNDPAIMLDSEPRSTR